MALLVDTSIMARRANSAVALHNVAELAVLELHNRGEILHITSQNPVEFRNVATRPTTNNGLGLVAIQAEAKSAKFEAAFPLLPETPDILPAWKAIVQSLGVIGKQVHDARLVAVCHVHGIAGLLPFNVAHFGSLAGFGPGIIIVDPQKI